MSTTMTNEEKVLACPEPLQAIIEEFQSVEPRDRIEYLIDYAMDLPDLPERLADEREGMEQVHECMTPVFLFTEIEDGVVHFYFDIPQESPTVRGYAGILVEGLAGAHRSRCWPCPMTSTCCSAFTKPSRRNGCVVCMRWSGI